jgi:hypothetical protein
MGYLEPIREMFGNPFLQQICNVAGWLGRCTLHGHFQSLRE